MTEGSSNIPFIIAAGAAVASLVGVVVLFLRLRAQARRYREVTQRSAEAIAKLKTENAQLRFAIRKKVINAKTDRDLVKYFNDLLERIGADGG